MRIYMDATGDGWKIATEIETNFGRALFFPQILVKV